MDRRNNKLIFKVHFLEMEERILVDFRLSKVWTLFNSNLHNKLFSKIFFCISGRRFGIQENFPEA